MRSLKQKNILILEDERFLAKQLQAYCTKLGAKALFVSTIEEARLALSKAENSFDLGLFDVYLPDGRSFDLLKEENLTEGMSVIVMTSEGSIDLAIEAMRLGALDFLTKPFELAELPLVFSRCLEKQQNKRIQEHKTKQQKNAGKSLFFGKRLELVNKQVEKILIAEEKLKSHIPPILIEGETGTGKTTLAKWLHEKGTRSKKEIVHLNCSAISEQLAESELFGHEKGAFTDAQQVRIGLFEAAHESTLFLDEIASLSLNIQAKILTAIEERQIRRVGGNRTIPIDVKLICASQRNLKEMVREGTFREDLYHRLDLLKLRVPSLKECRQDLVQLSNHLLKNLSKRYGSNEHELSPTGIQRLRSYDWPGNVRELAHELEKAIILESEDQLELINLASTLSLENNDIKAISEDKDDWLNPLWKLPEEGFSIEEAIHRWIKLSMEECDGNLSAAARRLGVPRDYLRYRLRKK